MLIELHILQNHAPANLNRDDTGSPKDCMFGGVRRGRISSQCLKRSIRRSDMFREGFNAENLATRTRRLPRLVRDRLLERGISQELADAAMKKATGFGTDKGKEQDQPHTAQTMFLTEADINAITDVMEKAIHDHDDDLKKFKKAKTAELQKDAELAGYRPLTTDIALFGRMTTSPAFRDAQASCQVAHALSTHRVDHEFDYYTAMDDLLRSEEVEEDPGADMIGDVEYNSATYYKYLNVNPRALAENLTGRLAYRRQEIDEEDIKRALELTREAVRRLIQAAVLVTPTGKQNSFASHTPPALVFVEVRPNRTPISYANAFVKPVRATGKVDLVSASVEAFKQHVAAISEGFNLEATSRLWLAPGSAVDPLEGADVVSNLNELLARVDEALASAAAGGRLHG